MQKESYKKLLIVGIFTIAMAYLESVVVVYLRKIYYMGGFGFPLVQIEQSVLRLEWVREFFTIVMLACIAFLAGKKVYEKIAYFAYSFAVWDIFYYVWLKIILNWPSSFFTWDLLFLIPIPWISPVLAPIICSLDMIILCICIINLKDSGYEFKITLKEWGVLILGSLFILYTFMIDYLRIIINEGVEGAYSFVPAVYNWLLFGMGEICIILVIILIYKRTIRNKKNNLK